MLVHHHYVDINIREVGPRCSISTNNAALLCLRKINQYYYHTISPLKQIRLANTTRKK